MAKREWPLRFKCGHEGCVETVTFRYPTHRDLESSFELNAYSGGKWRCSRHERMEEILSADNPSTRHEVVSVGKPHGNYWESSGFVYGPGFRAWASDFPAGTKLIVTATIELPTEGGND